jgi:unsaturated chondroitin disaccharide hydrolase
MIRNTCLLNGRSILLLLLLCSSAAFAQDKKEMNNLIDSSIRVAAQQYMQLNRTLTQGTFPRSINPDGTLMTNQSDWWTSGFYPGSLWYIYQNTREDSVKKAAIERTKSVEKEKLNTGDHDIGFKVMCSFGNQMYILEDANAVPIITTAAASLVKRFNPKVGSIRSWGKLDDDKMFTVIIDNMMNLELLFAATRLAHDSMYYKIAVTHAETTMANHFRADGSSYHVVDYDPKTGAVLKKRTAQGFADESAWARGQAWALYGFTVCYRETNDRRFLDKANNIAKFMLRHPNLPKDKIPCWDFNAPGAPNVTRDASAGAIMASALLNLSQYVSESMSVEYLNAAKMIIYTLSQPAYRSAPGENQNFLLKHSVGSLPAKSEVDVPLSYADYYYLEAMLRYKKLTNK